MVRRCALSLVAAISLTFITHIAAAPQAANGLGVDQFLGAASPLEVVTAARADRVAWVVYDKGRRNVYTAAAPSYAPVKLTNFPDDDGVDLTGVTISADGSTVVFVRGSAPNRDGWNANPSANPDGSEQAIWAARTATPGVAWKVIEGSNPVLSPDGRYILLARDGQIYRARVPPARPAASTSDEGRAYSASRTVSPFDSSRGSTSRASPGGCWGQWW